MTEHLDVLIVGAGISGIGCAHHLQEQHPGKSFAILEAHAAFGGARLIHTYPGVRSDSDLLTFGYRFKPWIGPPIATGAEILRCLGEVLEESGLADKTRCRRKVVAASWDTTRALWRVEIEHLDTRACPRPTHPGSPQPAWPRVRRRDPFHAALPALGATDRLLAGRRPVRRRQIRPRGRSVAPASPLARLLRQGSDRPSGGPGTAAASPARRGLLPSGQAEGSLRDSGIAGAWD